MLTYVYDHCEEGYIIYPFIIYAGILSPSALVLLVYIQIIPP